MDATEILMGTQTIGLDVLNNHVLSKAVALRAAFDRLNPLGSWADFESFVRSVPPSIVTTYFGSDGIDQHYTRMFGGIAAGRQTFDAVVATVTNAILQQMLYQGRYLMKQVPISEAFVAIDPWYEVGMALGNVKGIETLALGVPFELEAADRARAELLVTSFRELLWGTPESLAEFTRIVPRDVGCLAWYDINPASSHENFDAMVAALQPALGPDTFYLFAGDAETVLDIRQQLAAEFASAEIEQKIYPHFQDGAFQLRAILLATGLVKEPKLALKCAPSSYRYLDRAAVKTGGAAGVSSFDVGPSETIVVREPIFVSSSAPLLDRQLETITKDLQVGHEVYRLIGGKVINAVGPHAISYVIASQENQIIEPAHYPLLLENGEYGKPDQAGYLEVKHRPVMRVAGSALLFAFSPAIVAYHSHFLLQCLPNVIVAETIGDDGLRLLVSSSLKSYQYRMLEKLGWGRDRLVVLDPSFDYICETLYVPAVLPAIFSAFASPVYDRLVKIAEHTPVDRNKRIIISRAARTTWRNLVNYDAVCDQLVTKLGFEVVEPDTLTVEDEIRLFRSCAIVLGAEGAGLYNCCFMSPNTDVIVLADEDYAMYVVGSMAEIRDFDVTFVFGESFQAKRDLDRRVGHADFVIDPLRVLRTVEKVISRRNGER